MNAPNGKGAAIQLGVNGVLNGALYASSANLVLYTNTKNLLIENPAGKFIFATTGRFGIGGVYTPTYDLSFSGQAMPTIAPEYNTTAATNGTGIKLGGGGCTTGMTNGSSSPTIIETPLGTGNTNFIALQINTPDSNASGTTRQLATTKAQMRNKRDVSFKASSTDSSTITVRNTSSGKAVKFVVNTATIIAEFFVNNTRKAFIDLNGYLHNNSPHAVQEFMDSSISITLTQDVWIQIKNQASNGTFANNELEGWTESRDTSIASYAGDFYFDSEVNLTGQNGKDYEYRIVRRRAHVNTVVWSYGITSAGLKTLRRISHYVDANVGDRFWIEIKSPSVSPGSVTLHGGHIIIDTK